MYKLYLLPFYLAIILISCSSQYMSSPDQNTDQNTGMIKFYTQNPFYWEYEGKPLFLCGGSERDNIFQWASEGTKLTGHLDTLKMCGGNYLRCTMSSREYTPERFRWDILPYPYQKVNGKYDLTRWNDVYWDKLNTFLRETQKREIIVQLELWDRWNEAGNSEGGNNGWYYSPYNPNNNWNYSWEDSPLLKPGKTDFYNSFHYAAVQNDSLLLPIQQGFIEKIMDEVIDNGFGHVIFQIDNESGIGDSSLEPDPYWANYIREYSKSKNADHLIYVCSSRRLHDPSPYITTNFQDWSNPEIQVPIVNPAFNFCDISQNNGNNGQKQYDNFIWYRTKVHENGVRPINNVKCYHFDWNTGDSWKDRKVPTDEDALSKFWRAAFAGIAGIRFHRDTPAQIRDGFGLSPEAQIHIKSMRMLVDSISLFKMNPNNELLSARTDDEAYCLAEPGKQYAVFFTGKGDRSVGINLNSASQPFAIKWLDINHNVWYDPVSIQGGGIQNLTIPGSGPHWVALLMAENKAK